MMDTEALTNEQINLLVAEKVMGWKRYTGDGEYISPKHVYLPGTTDYMGDHWDSSQGHPRLVSPEGDTCYLCPCQQRKSDVVEIPDYAGDIAAAFDAFTQASKKSFMKLYYSDVEEMWRVSFPDRQHTIRDKSPSRVMSLAALKAVRVEGEG